MNKKLFDCSWGEEYRMEDNRTTKKSNDGNRGETNWQEVLLRGGQIHIHIKRGIHFVVNQRHNERKVSVWK